MLDFLLKASPLRARERGPQPSAWKVLSANFAFWGFSEDEMRRPTLNAVPYGLQILVTGSYAQ
jgi:hypothetical protein